MRVCGAGLFAHGGAGHGGADRFAAGAPGTPHGPGIAAIGGRDRTAPALERYARAYGAQPERLAGGVTAAQPVRADDNRLYVRDYSGAFCATSACKPAGIKVQKTYAIAVAGRGFDAHIDTGFDVPLGDSPCVYCGNCVAVCPTGALIGRTEYDMRQAGIWDDNQQKRVRIRSAPTAAWAASYDSTCRSSASSRCPGLATHPVTSGFLCVKGRFGYEFLHGGSEARRRRQRAARDQAAEEIRPAMGISCISRHAGPERRAR